MRVICRVCGYVSKSLPDYRRHVEENKECDVSRLSKREARRKRREEAKQAAEDAVVAASLKGAYVPVKSVRLGAVLSKDVTLKEHIIYTIPKPVCFTVLPGKRK